MTPRLDIAVQNVLVMHRHKMINVLPDPVARTVNRTYEHQFIERMEELERAYRAEKHAPPDTREDRSGVCGSLRCCMRIGENG